jgi:hypothetical protein
MSLKPVFYLLLLILPLQLAAQDLRWGRKNSYFTYIFRLENRDAAELMQGNRKRSPDPYLTNLHDSFPSDSIYRKKLPTGHYMFVNAIGNRLDYAIHSVNATEVQLYDNRRDLSILVFDIQSGATVTDAVVTVDGKNIPYDTTSLTYLLPRSGRDGFVIVKRKDEWVFHRLDIMQHISRTGRTLNKISYAFPLKYILYPFRFLAEGIFNGEVVKLNGDNRLYKKYHGYVAMSKPKYMPGDSVKLKAFIVNRKGKPYKREITVAMVRYGYYSKPTEIGTALKHGKGAYTFEFRLADSLELNRYYEMRLLSKKKRALLETSFYLEDYQLEETSYRLRSGRTDYLRGDSIVVFASGLDANGLPVPDARATFTVTAREINKIYTDSVFIPNLIFTHKQPLLPSGETRIIIPDNLLPAANLKLKIKAVFNNSNNETHMDSFTVDYKGLNEKIEVKLKGKFLYADHIVNGKPVAGIGTLHASGDSIAERNISFPYVAPINPTVHSYTFSKGELESGFYPSHKGAGIVSHSYRTADSVFIRLSNPAELDISYNIYKGGNRQVVQGNTKNLDLKFRDPSGDSWYLSWHYLWGGFGHSENSSIHLLEKNLNVDMIQPAVVNPGQKVNVEVRVTDIHNDPVPDVDLTAMAVNSLFKDPKIPEPPYLGGRKHERTTLSSFRLTNISYLQRWKLTESWRKRMRLDTIAFYRMLYPEGGLTLNYNPISSNNAEFAAFIMKEGNPLNVYLVYVDGKLAYYSGTRNLYAIPVRPGIHNIHIRCSEKEYTLRNVHCKKGFKLDISIDAEHAPDSVSIGKIKSRLSDNEKYILNRTMLVNQTYFYGKPAFAWQGDRAWRLRDGQHLIGPLEMDSLHFAVQDEFKSTVIFEPGYEYTFKKGLVKMVRAKEFKGKMFPDPYYEQFSDMGATSLPNSAIWLHSLAKPSTELFRNPEYTMPGNGTYCLELKTDSVIALIKIIRLDSVLNHRYYRRQTMVFHDLLPGYYHLQFITCAGTCMYRDSVHILPDGTLFERLNDSDFINRILLDKSTGKPVFWNDDLSIIFRRSPEGTALGKLSGNIKSKNTGEALNGASIMLQQHGQLLAAASAGLDGNFSIVPLPAGIYDIVIRMHGYISRTIPGIEVKANENNFHAWTLEESAIESVPGLPQYDNSWFPQLYHQRYGKSRLQAYKGRKLFCPDFGEGGSLNYEDNSDFSPFRGNQWKSNRYGDNASIQGSREMNAVMIASKLRRAPSMAQQKGYFSETNFDFENQYKLGYDKYEDGITYKIELGNVPIKNTVLGLYDSLIPGNLSLFGIPASYGDIKQMRDRFSDVGYWQPVLITDSAGKAVFEVTFPDNITTWNSYALAMNSNKQSGKGFSSTKSFKTLMASLALPRFLVEGDSSSIIGKVLNYTGAPLQVTSTFLLNDRPVYTKDTLVNEAVIETVALQPMNTDTLHLTYSITAGNGSRDGEKRDIQVFPAGVKESKGSFYKLNGDTVISIPAGFGSETYLYAQDNLLEVLLKEAEDLENYPYGCMEQSASKLKGLLAQKEINELLGKRFNKNSQIRMLIRKLEKGQQEDGSWGWWENSPSNIWMTCYVLGALQKAEVRGFRPDERGMLRGGQYLGMRLDYMESNELLASLNTLSELNRQVAFAPYLRSIENKDLTLNQQLMVMKIKQQQKLPFDIDTLKKIKKETLFGSVYWGEESYDWYENSTANTLIAYRILERADTAHPLLPSIRNYFLELRSQNKWRNTIETSSILETILPGLIRENKEVQPSKIVLSGTVENTVSEFPHQSKLMGNGKDLQIRKTGSGPVYLSLYENNFNRSPLAVDSLYSISSRFEESGKQTDSLHAGVPTEMVVEVTAAKKAGYVMIEIPIPAGCSYGDNNGKTGYNEVHREYFRHKTSIFCQELPAGKHVFRIALQPRFTGSFVLNPAKAELMYFPVFYGRNGTKKVSIR